MGERSRRADASRAAMSWLAAASAAAVIALVVALTAGGHGSNHVATAKATPTTVHHVRARTAPGSSAGTAPSPAPAAVGLSPGGTSATAPPPAAQSTAAPSTAGPAPGASTAPGAAPVPAGSSPGAPAVVAMSPKSGPAGSTVSFTGRGLFSPSGSITVLFGQVQAPVECPTQQSCTATVPAQPPGSPGHAPAASVPVTVTTDSGRSAPIAFTYAG